MAERHIKICFPIVFIYDLTKRLFIASAQGLLWIDQNANYQCICQECWRLIWKSSILATNELNIIAGFKHTSCLISFCSRVCMNKTTYYWHTYIYKRKG